MPKVTLRRYGRYRPEPGRSHPSPPTAITLALPPPPKPLPPPARLPSGTPGARWAVGAPGQAVRVHRLTFLTFHRNEQYKVLSHTAVSGAAWMLLGSPVLQLLAPSAQELELREAGSPGEQKLICIWLCFDFYLNVASFSNLSLSACMRLSLKRVSCRQHIHGSCFCIHSASLCLLVGVLSPFTFKVIID